MLDYLHHWICGKSIDLPVGKVICVGRNYVEHIKELGNHISSSPILFMKPSTALVEMEKPILLPQFEELCHYEIEVAALIGRKMKHPYLCKEEDAILGYGLAIDLTLRNLQENLKKNGHPWEICKSFDASCPISPFVPARELNYQNIEFSLSINEKICQKGNTKEMIFPIPELIQHICKYFTLLPGDIILTGTPKGVGALQHRDKLEASLASYTFKTSIE